MSQSISLLGAPVQGRRTGAGLEGMAEAELERSERLAAIRAGEVASIHSWELVTAVDGPGTRLTVFFSGCPLRCVYCHNPDTMEMRRGQDVELEEMIARIKRYRTVFRASGGGITLSGGEVLMQPVFAGRVLRAATEMGIHTAIDTSGYLGAVAGDAFLADVDLVLLDVKSGSEESYRALTGRPLQPTLDFGDRLARLGTTIWIRFVVVPGWTDEETNVEQVAENVARWKDVVERVEVLPFHNMGQDKWDALGMDYKLRDAQPPRHEVVERVRGQFRARGLTVSCAGRPSPSTPADQPPAPPLRTAGGRPAGPRPVPARRTVPDSSLVGDPHAATLGRPRHRPVRHRPAQCLLAAGIDHQRCRARVGGQLRSVRAGIGQLRGQPSRLAQARELTGQLRAHRLR